MTPYLVVWALVLWLWSGVAMAGRASLASLVWSLFGATVAVFVSRYVRREV